MTFCCILSKFYIKPQPLNWDSEVDVVVSYRNSTSNHNFKPSLKRQWKVVSYRNSTSNHNPPRMRHQSSGVVSYRNSTSNHNYKTIYVPTYCVVSYRNSTSNHNGQAIIPHFERLYLIEILHQTTTARYYLRELLCCILSKFYIKPQLGMGSRTKR